MNESDLREALRTTVQGTPAPPPMDSRAAITAGRRAVLRRNLLAATGAAVAVTALTAGIALPQFGGGLDVTPAAEPSTIPGPADTKPSWPVDENGVPQEDATARTGPRAAQGQKVLDGILAVIPDGYTSPDESEELRDHQAAVENGDSWGYLAHAAVRKGDGTGQLLVEVHTAGNGLASEPCALAQQFWNMKGTCEVVTVGRAKVGVVTKPAADHRLDQWAAYRYPDGIVVFVAQGRNATMGDSRWAPLPKVPMTVRQLAAVAVDTRFHLS